MRDLNEYKAEIFRRSHERIEKRKKIKKSVLGLSAVFCLCMVLWSINVLNMEESGDKDLISKEEDIIFKDSSSNKLSSTDVAVGDKETINDDQKEDLAGSKFTTIEDVLILIEGDNKENKKITDKTVATNLFTELSAAMENTTQIHYPMEEVMNAESERVEEEIQQKAPFICTITFNEIGDLKHVFKLRNNVLTDELTNTTFTLDKESYEKIKSLITN